MRTPSPEPDDLPDSAFTDVRVITGSRSGLEMGVAIHSLVDGRSLGGCRVKPYASRLAAVRDVKRLARAMTFKASAAGLTMGGGKAMIALDGEPLSGDRRRAALLDFGELVDSLGGRYVTAQDVGTTADDIAALAEVTPYVAGRPIATGGCGDPSPFTAHGVEVAIRASLPGGTVAGRHIVVIGLGHVGGALAERLAAAGARLTITDIDPRRRELADRLGARWIDPSGSSEALFEPADLIAPCALGGVLDAATVRGVQAPVIAGAANNQLADDTVAADLARRGIRWAPDYIVNAGGLIAVTDEYLSGGRSHPAAVEAAIAAIGETLADVYRRAETRDGNTLTAAAAIASERAAAHRDAA